MNLSRMTNEELNELSVKCLELIDARNRLEKMLDGSNLTMDDLKNLRIGMNKASNTTKKKNKVGAPKGVKVAPKWRHKEDSALTWSGRGLTPKWVKKYGVKV